MKPYIEEIQMTDLISAWQRYLNGVQNWENLIKDIKPKPSGCGLIYELANPLNRLNESFAIADMRNIQFAEPHYHPEIEIYFVLQGFGLIVIGGKEEFIQKDSVIVLPSNIAHFTIPKKDLVIAVVNTPPFRAENYIALKEENSKVKFDKAQFDVLIERNQKSL